MKAICNSHTERERWLAERNKGIGASDIAALIGLSKWDSPLSLYAQKIGVVQPEADVPEYIEWGNRLEGVILEAYHERTGRSVERSGILYEHDKYPFARATFDAFTALDGARFPLQAKNAGEYKAEEWAEGVPAWYDAQLQWETFVANAPGASIACLLGGRRMIWDDTERNEALIARMLDAASKFWRCVETRTPPPADGSEFSRDALKLLYPKDTGEIKLLPATLIEVADVLEVTKVESKKVEEVRLMAENTIKAAMGDATFGVLPDGRRFSWTTQARKGYTVQASESRVFRALKSKEGD